MRNTKKFWRTFKTKDSGLRKQARQWFRRICAMIMFAELVILWRQTQIPLISVDRQSDSGMEYLEAEKEERERTVLEQIFGVRLRVEDGVIEFYRKEEKMDVIPEEK